MPNCTHARPCWLQLPCSTARVAWLHSHPSVCAHAARRRGQAAGRQAAALLHLLARAHHPRRHRHRFPSSTRTAPIDLLAYPVRPALLSPHMPACSSHWHDTPAAGHPALVRDASVRTAWQPPTNAHLCAVRSARSACRPPCATRRSTTSRPRCRSTRRACSSSFRSLARSSSALSPLFKLGSDRFIAVLTHRQLPGRPHLRRALSVLRGVVSAVSCWPCAGARACSVVASVRALCIALSRVSA